MCICLGVHVKNTRELILKRTTRNEEDEYTNITIPLSLHHGNSKVILINSPGLGVAKDGENGQFKNIANRLQRSGIASVIRYQSSLGDFAFKKIGMEPLLMDNLREVINYALKEAHLICGSKTPELFLAGHSAGASTSAAVAYEYPQVSKMLLIAPSADIDPELVRKGLLNFSGELYITIGDKDYVISQEAAQNLVEWATKAKSRKLVTVSDCDHDFSGEINSKKLCEAYFWAFNEG